MDMGFLYIRLTGSLVSCLLALPSGSNTMLQVEQNPGQVTLNIFLGPSRHSLVLSPWQTLVINLSAFYL